MSDRLAIFAQRAYSTLGTLHATYDMAANCIINNVPGDFVECGVAAGSQVAAMAQAIMDVGGQLDNGDRRRRVHLFDSFQGIPKGGEFDGDIEPLVGKASGSAIELSGVTAHSLAEVKDHMRGWGIPDELLVYHPGWFHETVPTAEIGQIALLRLDGDLYESTRVCMEHLYPRLAPGGWCIIDDFDLDGCRKSVLESAKTGPVYFQGHRA